MASNVEIVDSRKFPGRKFEDLDVGVYFFSNDGMYQKVLLANSNANPRGIAVSVPDGHECPTKDMEEITPINIRIEIID
jgi:hypothetical protein